MEPLRKFEGGGEQMDRKIKKKKWTIKRIATILGVSLFVAFVIYQFGFADRRSKLRVDREKIMIAEVRRGVFQERIPQTGTVLPARTVYLDALEGGNIKRIEAESGEILKKGDVILELSNYNREMSVLGQEASLNESINQLRQMRLQLAQNDLQQKSTLAQIESQLSILKPQYERTKTLYEKNLIAKQEFEKIEADYNYNLTRKEITLQQYKLDSQIAIQQQKQMVESERRMLENLSGLSHILENLVVRAPIDGQLTRPELEIGQSITAGFRLGQIDEIGGFKVRASIDELYLARISPGLQAIVTNFTDKEYKLEITYVYPTVREGRFDVDMKFITDPPAGLIRGQSLRLLIELGQSSEETLLPQGGFYKDTGGNWVYVLDESGDQAVRRDIRLGRKSGAEYYEVLEGLQPGDRVITSSYETFGDNEVLLLN